MQAKANLKKKFSTNWYHFLNQINMKKSVEKREIK